MADQIPRLDRAFFWRCGHGGPDAVSACLWSKNSRAAMDRTAAGAVACAVAYCAGIVFAGALVFFAGAGTVVFAGGILLLNKRAIKYRGQGVFQSLFLPGMVLACLATANV